MKFAHRRIQIQLSNPIGYSLHMRYVVAVNQPENLCISYSHSLHMPRFLGPHDTLSCFSVLIHISYPIESSSHPKDMSATFQ